MMRSIFTLCCLGLLGGAIAAAVLGTNDRFHGSLGRQSVRLNHHRADDRYFDRQHSLPLFADADETDDTEESSDPEKGAAAYYASRHFVAGPSPRTARFEAAVQLRLANTLTALGVRLQI